MIGQAGRLKVGRLGSWEVRSGRMISCSEVESIYIARPSLLGFRVRTQETYSDSVLKSIE